MSLQDTYDELKMNSSVTVAGTDSELKSLYVMLFRKHQSYCESMESIGFLGDNFKGTTVSVKYSAGTATYRLARKRQPKQYTIIRAGNQDAPETESLRTDLVSDQESTIRDGSRSPSPQDYGADSDSLREEREDDGSSSDEEYWRAYRRSLGSSSDDLS